jgi:hypothetical protein
MAAAAAVAPAPIQQPATAGPVATPTSVATNDLLHAVPAVFKQYANWVTHKDATKKGKVPVISGTTRYAATDDPTTWVSYETACANVAAGRGYKNLGFVTDGERTGNLAGIDLDGSLNNRSGEITPWGQRILDFLGPTYVEITPSGDGLRAWVVAAFPAGGNVFKLARSSGWGDKVQVEVYSDARYFCVTGKRYGNSPSVVAPLANVDALLSLLRTIAAENPAEVEPGKQTKPKEKKSKRTVAVEKPGGGIVFVPAEPDPGFKLLFDEVGWAPLERRMDKMSDARYEGLKVEPGLMTYCPMPGHGERDEKIEYTKCFGAIKDNPAVVSCFGCHWANDLVNTVREFDGGEDGGHIAYKNNYDVARAICMEEGLVFTDYFPTAAPATVAATTPSSATKDQEAKLQEAIKDFAELQDKCDKAVAASWVSYPVHAWEGTAYALFGEASQAGDGKPNFIPREYFINAAMSMVGAAAGHRISPIFNTKLQARFITTLISRQGGIGKNETLGWTLGLLEPVGLIYRQGLPSYKNIGAYLSGFASARGMLETLEGHPIILQSYGELTTLLDKYCIPGSGESFKDLNLELADENRATPSVCKGFKGKLPDEVHNSIIGGTTLDRWEQSANKVNLETMIQRSNVILTEEIRTVGILKTPNYDTVRAVLFPRIAVLDTHKLLWDFDPEAEEGFLNWHRKLVSSKDADVIESIGRIQVYALRVIGHLALCLAPLPADAPVSLEDLRELRYAPREDKVWNVTVTPDIVRRAILVADNQILNRMATIPVQGLTLPATVENLLRKYVAAVEVQGWEPMKRRLRKYGNEVVINALYRLQKERVLMIAADPEDKEDQSSWTIIRVRKVSYRERRGGIVSSKQIQ